MEVHPPAVYLAPADVGVEVAQGDVSGKHLYRRPGVVSGAESRLYDGGGPEVLRGPPHPGEPLRRDRERRPAAAELGLDLERAPLLGPVVLHDVAHDPRRKVRERGVDGPLPRGLLQHDAVGRLAVGNRRRFVLLARGLPQLGRGERDEVLDRVAGVEVVVHALLGSVLAVGQVDQFYSRHHFTSRKPLSRVRAAWTCGLSMTSLSKTM